jgi:hypothetical protein
MLSLERQASKSVVRIAAVVLAVTFGLTIGSIVRAVPPSSKDTLTVTGLDALNAGTPDHTGSVYTYAYCLPSGSTVLDTIPVRFVITNGNTAGGSYSLSITKTPAVSGLDLSDVTGVTVLDDGVAVQRNIVLSVSGLADGTYEYVLLVGPSSYSSALSGLDTSIHIQITIGGACDPAPSGPDCLLTSSTFAPLTDCAGNEVKSNTGGTFAIVTNAKNKIVSTNPGSFYYNLIWKNNTGSDKVVQIGFDPTNLIPQGANAIHAYTFNGSGFTKSATNFDLVNQDGTPCGTLGPCTILVADGDVLWATWHGQYGEITKAVTDQLSACAETCTSTSSISVTGTLTDVTTSLHTSIGSCTASACGYVKKSN